MLHWRPSSRAWADLFRIEHLEGLIGLAHDGLGQLLGHAGSSFVVWLPPSEHTEGEGAAI